MMLYQIKFLFLALLLCIARVSAQGEEWIKSAYLDMENQELLIQFVNSEVTMSHDRQNKVYLTNTDPVTKESLRNSRRTMVLDSWENHSLFGNSSEYVYRFSTEDSIAFEKMKDTTLYLFVNNLTLENNGNLIDLSFNYPILVLEESPPQILRSYVLGDQLHIIFNMDINREVLYENGFLQVEDFNIPLSEMTCSISEQDSRKISCTFNSLQYDLVYRYPKYLELVLMNNFVQDTFYGAGNKGVVERLQFPQLVQGQLGTAGAVVNGNAVQLNFSEFYELSVDRRISYTLLDQSGNVLIEKFNLEQNLDTVFLNTPGLHRTTVSYLGYDSTQAWVNKTGSIQFEVKEFNTVSIQAGKWSMLGFGDKVVSKSILPTNVDLYKWDDAFSSNLYFEKYMGRWDLDSIFPGQAYWVYSEKNIDLELDYSTDNQSVLALLKKGDKGWNQITNPYPYTIDAGFLTFQKLPEVWEFLPETKDYKLVESIEPNKGYWVEVDETKWVEFPNIPLFETVENSVSGSLAKELSSNEWSIGLSLYDHENGYVDLHNKVGVSDNAEDDFDDMDQREFPAKVGDHISLSIINGEKLLRTDFQSADKETYSWDFGISSSTGTAVELQLEGLAEVRALGYNVYLQKGTSTQELTTESVQLSNSENVRLIVSKNSGELEKQFAPSPNMVEFALPIGMEGRAMEIELYDLNGSLMYSVVENAEAGVYQSINLMKNRDIKSGLYVYNIRVGSRWFSSSVYLKP